MAPVTPVLITFLIFTSVSLSSTIMSGDDKSDPTIVLFNLAILGSQTSTQPTSRQMSAPTSVSSHSRVIHHPGSEASCHGSHNCSAALSHSSEVKQCGLNSRQVGENCLCNQGFRKFPFSEFCVKDEGQPCQFQQNDCFTDITYMSCVNQVCMCDSSDVYDHISMRCVGKVGGLCFPGVKDCALNAECVNIPSKLRVLRSPSPYQYREEQMFSDEAINSGSDIELSGTCQCREGFVESRGELCKKGHGLPCATGDECDSLNLVCKEGICSCPDSLHIYDSQSKSCDAVVGANCSDEPGGNKCVRFASCVKINLKLPGRCQCYEGATAISSRTCVQHVGSSTLTTHSTVATLSDDNKIEESRRILFEP